MCGIIGYAGNKNALDVVMAGLDRLEYRGYDSAGITICSDKNTITEKAVGKLSALKSQVADMSLFGFRGMGHTRWATHGAPKFNNAHPHKYGRVTVIHNGILENYRAIKKKFTDLGHEFYSDTDTEVAAHLLDHLLDEGHEPLKAIALLCDTLHGLYALGIMIEGEDKVYFAKNGSPLVVAFLDGEAFFASDQTALVDYQPVFSTLNDYEMGYISEAGVYVCDIKGEAKTPKFLPLLAKKEALEKLGHKHFMHKEIFEQPEVLERVTLGRINEQGIDFLGFDIDFSRLKDINKIQIVACGSSYYAGLVARSAFESMLKWPVSVEIASEYRYRNPLIDSQTLCIVISQSGETIDTLEAAKKALSNGAKCISICNVLGSAIPTLCEKSAGNLFLNAGPEVSVASSKAFVAQLLALRLLATAMAKKFSKVDDHEYSAFLELKASMKDLLTLDEKIRSMAQMLIDEPRMLYIGRGDLLPIAFEGALKMKELSYISAEAYAAGELKHGPIAIIEQGTPVVVLFGSDPVHEKTRSNLQEAKARGAKIISILPKDISGISDESDMIIEYGQTTPELEPILATIPLQLLAYHLSDLKGIDVDKPRNLAKSVTVE
jgi:glucosamine--fructose-6-phosphate aminotransferase (isomerizing)